MSGRGTHLERGEEGDEKLEQVRTKVGDGGEDVEQKSKERWDVEEDKGR